MPEPHPDVRKETDLPFTFPFAFSEFKNNPRRALSRVKFVTARSPGKTSAVDVVQAALQGTAANHAKRMRGRFIHQSKGRGRRRHRINRSWLDMANTANAERRLLRWVRDSWGFAIRFRPNAVFIP